MCGSSGAFCDGRGACLWVLGAQPGCPPLPPPWPCPPAADLGNPYNRGWLGNCAAVFCTPIPPRWGQLGMRQRVEAAEAAFAEAARVQQEAMAAGMVPPGGGEVQMVPLPHAELEGGFRGSLKAADEAAAGSNGAGVEVLPYPDDEVRAGGGCVGCWAVDPVIEWLQGGHPSPLAQRSCVFLPFL